MSVPNFSSLAGIEVAEKFVVVVVGNTWLLCLTPTLVALELSWVALGFDNYLIDLPRFTSPWPQPAPTCTSPTRLLSTQQTRKQSTQTTVSTDSGAEEESLPPLVTGKLFCMHLCIMKHEINYLWNQHSHSLWDQSILWTRHFPPLLNQTYSSVKYPRNLTSTYEAQ